MALAGAGIFWRKFVYRRIPPLQLSLHICAATSILVWTCWDVLFIKKPSEIGAIQGMITGLGWAALVMGITSGTIP
uniref:Ammonium transporter AmtB-like domain-containing protein n=1 Tax=Populus trichocarpa TaxID=3694 RepID=A0A2K1XEN2_POPTR